MDSTETTLMLVEGDEARGMMSEAEREQVIAWFAGGSTPRDVVALCQKEFGIAVDHADARLFYRVYRSQIADKAREIAMALTEIPRHDVGFVMGKLDHHAVLLEEMMQAAAEDEAPTVVVKLTDAWLRVLALMQMYRPPIPAGEGPQPLSKQLDALPPEAKHEAMQALTTLQNLIATHTTKTE